MSRQPEPSATRSRTDGRLERYLELLATTKIKGTKFLQQNYIQKMDEEMDRLAKVHTSDKIGRINEKRFSN